MSLDDMTFYQQSLTHRTLCPQTASLSIAATISTVSGPRLTKMMCILDPAALGMKPRASFVGARPKKRPEGLLARLSMGAAAIAGGSPIKGGGSPARAGLQGSPRKSTSSKATALKVCMLASCTAVCWLTCPEWEHVLTRL